MKPADYTPLPIALEKWPTWRERSRNDQIATIECVPAQGWESPIVAEVNLLDDRVGDNLVPLVAAAPELAIELRAALHYIKVEAAKAPTEPARVARQRKALKDVERVTALLARLGLT
jgi:hypothetical protein